MSNDNFPTDDFNTDDFNTDGSSPDGSSPDDSPHVDGENSVPELTIQPAASAPEVDFRGEISTGADAPTARGNRRRVILLMIAGGLIIGAGIGVPSYLIFTKKASDAESLASKAESAKIGAEQVAATSRKQAEEAELARAQAAALAKAKESEADTAIAARNTADGDRQAAITARDTAFMQRDVAQEDQGKAEKARDIAVAKSEADQARAEKAEADRLGALEVVRDLQDAVATANLDDAQGRTRAIVALEEILALPEFQGDSPERASRLNDLAFVSLRHAASITDVAQRQEYTDKAIATANSLVALAERLNHADLQLDAHFQIGTANELAARYEEASAAYLLGLKFATEQADAEKRQARFQAGIIRSALAKSEAETPSTSDARRPWANVRFVSLFVASAAPLSLEELQTLLDFALQGQKLNPDSPALRYAVGQTYVRIANHHSATEPPDQVAALTAHRSAVDQFAEGIDIIARLGVTREEDPQHNLRAKLYAGYVKSDSAIRANDEREEALAEYRALYEAERKRNLQLAPVEERWKAMASAVASKIGFGVATPDLTDVDATQKWENDLTDFIGSQQAAAEMSHSEFEKVDGELTLFLRADIIWHQTVSQIAKLYDLDVNLPPQESRWTAGNEESTTRHLGDLYTRISQIAAEKPEGGVTTRNSPTAEQLLAREFFGQGRLYFHDGQFQEAIDAFTGSIEYDPRDARFYYFRGLSKKCLDDADSAEADADMKRGRELENLRSPDSRVVGEALERIQGQPRVWLESFRTLRRASVENNSEGS